jgi:ABC-type lipoprotein export system ATPase subunit
MEAAMTTHDAQPVIDVREVWRTYRAGTPQEVHALRGVSLQVPEHSFMALKGRSGSGKTTLLNCIGGLDRPTRGEIIAFGQSVAHMKESELTRFRRSNVAFIFQSFGLNPNFSALENVELMLLIAGQSPRQANRRAVEVLDLVGMGRWKHHRPDELSGGQQQRIAIARALANNPRLILADEPTGDLDTATARDVLSLFRRISAEQGVTLLVSSHDPIIRDYAQGVIELSDGQLLGGV